MGSKIYDGDVKFFGGTVWIGVRRADALCRLRFVCCCVHRHPLRLSLLVPSHLASFFWVW